MSLNKKKKQLIVLALTSTMLLETGVPIAMTQAPVVSAAEAVPMSGNCSATAADQVTWVLTRNAEGTETYTLTISGTGKMKDYLAVNESENRNHNVVGRANTKITRVVVGNGITHIGSFAFAVDSSDVKSIELPNSVTSIGEGAFNDSGLETMYFNGTRLQWYLVEKDYSGIPSGTVVVGNNNAAGVSPGSQGYGAVMIDTAQYTMAPGGIYDIGVVVRDGNGTQLSAGQVRKLVSSGLLKVRDSRTGSVTALTQLANGNFRVTGKKEGTTYILYEIGGTHASVRVDVKKGSKAGGNAVRNTSKFTQSVAFPADTPVSSSSLSQSEKQSQAMQVARQIAASIQGNTDLEKVRKAAKIVSMYCRDSTYTMEGKDYATAYGVFVKGEYSCAGATRALGMVLDCMGYKWKHVNPNQYTHQWCELTMDGKQGYADGQGGFAGYGKHIQSLDWDSTNSDDLFNAYLNTLF